MLGLHKMVLAQTNGEFWWLSDKLDRPTKIESPKFEQLSELDTDENDKIFYGNDEGTGDNKIEEYKKWNSNRKGKENSVIALEYEDDKKGLAWQTHGTIIINENESTKTTAKHDTIYATTQKYDDELNFHYPNDKDVVHFINVSLNDNNKIMSSPNSVMQLNIIKPSSETTSKPKQNNYESICTYMDEEECKRYNGLVYKRNKKRFVLKFGAPNCFVSFNFVCSNFI